MKLTWRRARRLWHLAWTEHTTPREVGFAVALGVFVGCSPAIGFHAIIALGLSTMLRLSRVWSFLGSRISSVIVLPWIAIAEVELAHRVRAGQWLHLTREQLMAQRHHLLLDWVLGWFPVGIVTSLFFGLLAALVFRLRRRKFAVL